MSLGDNNKPHVKDMFFLTSKWRGNGRIYVELCLGNWWRIDVVKNQCYKYLCTLFPSLIVNSDRKLHCHSSFFFLNGAELSLNSINSGNLINHWSMNFGQFKDPLCYQHLLAAENGCWYLITEAVWIQWPFLQKNSTYSVDSTEFI